MDYVQQIFKIQHRRQVPVLINIKWEVPTCPLAQSGHYADFTMHYAESLVIMLDDDEYGV